MPDNSRKFHEFALQTSLFKGRPDWYFCYLKAEKIAHVLVFIGASAGASAQENLDQVARRAGGLSSEIAHLAAGEVDVSVVLADALGLLSNVRFLVAQGGLSSQNGLLLVGEYEQLCERLVRGSNPSPLISGEDFSIPSLPQSQALLGGSLGFSLPQSDIKDRQAKGQSKGQDKRQNKGQTDRMSLILKLVREKKSLSIKEIAAVVKGCSEKTIQRELGALIERGLIKKVGERRWSLYQPA